MIDLEKLRVACDRLVGTSTGVWLNDRLMSLEAEKKGSANTLLLISSAREMQRAFPEGLKLNSAWVELFADDLPERMVTAVQSCDLIIWAMSATRLFSGEFAPVLNAAQKERVPVWAIVVGLERLTDRKEFITKIIPKNRARLPDHSEILYTRDDVQRLLAAKGEILAATGHARRSASLLTQLGQRLGEERKGVNESLMLRRRYLETAQSGVKYICVILVVA